MKAEDDYVIIPSKIGLEFHPSYKNPTVFLSLQCRIKVMEGLLTPLKTTVSDTKSAEPQLAVFESKSPNGQVRNGTLQSPEDILNALKSKPDSELLTRVLRWLDPGAVKPDQFNIKIPSPKAAQIIFLLVSETIPDYWRTWQGADNPTLLNQKRLLLRCLSSVSGLGAIAARLRIFMDLKEDARSEVKVTQSSKSQALEEMLDVLESLLQGKFFISRILTDISSLISIPSQRTLLWKDFITTIAGGRVLSLAAEADHFVNQSSPNSRPRCWLGDGSQYSSWLGENLAHSLIDQVQNLDVLAQLFSRALKLGYIDHCVEAVCSRLIYGDDTLLTNYWSLLKNLGAQEQITFLYSLIRILSKLRLSSLTGNLTHDEQQEHSRILCGAGALISCLVKDSDILKDALIRWLTGVSGDGIAQEKAIRRAVIAALSVDHARMIVLFNKILELFGDKLFIKHTAMLHQQVLTQVLLMTAGYIQRKDAQELSNIAQSSLYISAISNRLAASTPRASLLGMITATAVSELVDPKDKQMNFSMEEVHGAEGQWYRNLTKQKDVIGSIGDLKPVSGGVLRKWQSSSPKSRALKSKPLKPSSAANTSSKIISIVELDDSSESEDDDLVPYEKPDSDPEDSEEDATLVQRGRPVAPVYIRDLIAGLRDIENYDQHKLAILTAPSLIRRKATFGTEVTEHIETLASLLVGLSDKYEIEKFQEKRLQCLIAVVVAQPLEMGQWFSRSFFNGDYSIGQRAAILTALGLGARELAGFGTEDAAITGADNPLSPTSSFPTKKLPEKLHKIFASNDDELSTSPINKISSSLENFILQPMAATAADKLSGPNALKVRTFSSRMSVEAKRTKPIPNALAKIVADGFFLPLTGLWRIHLQSYGRGGGGGGISHPKTPYTQPPLLPLLLKTLSLLLHAAGPSTLSLPLLTSEFWSLLLSLLSLSSSSSSASSSSSSDPEILEAILFGFLTILNVNTGNKKLIAEEMGKELLETRGWVEGVFERVGEGRVKVLAAGVLGGVAEVVGEYERVILGGVLAGGWI